VTTPRPEIDYAAAVVGRLQEVLGGDLHAAYLIGSLALGDYSASSSDIDIAAVSSRPLSRAEKEAIVARVSQSALACPARGLELVVYTRAALATPTRNPRFELSLNTGERMEQHVSFDESSEPRHWFVLDLAIAAARARPLLGPPARETFAPIPREWILEALAESLRWHQTNDALGYQTVLNGARSWRYAEEATWSSKSEAARWARSRMPDPTLVDRALASRQGADYSLDPEELRAFLRHVRGVIAVASSTPPRRQG